MNRKYYLFFLGGLHIIYAVYNPSKVSTLLIAQHIDKIAWGGGIIYLMIFKEHIYEKNS
jgi:hypothetical protein